MNDPLQAFSELAARARKVPAPPVDVIARVLSDLAGRRPRRASDRLLWTLSGAAALAASVMALVGFLSYSAISDALPSLLEPLSMVIQ